MADSNVGAGVTAATAAAAVIGGLAAYQAVANSNGSASSDFDAVRFLNQATFGATSADIASFQKLGMNGWLDAQRNAKINDKAFDLVTLLDEGLRADQLAALEADKLAGNIDEQYYQQRKSVINAISRINGAVFQRVMMWLHVTGADQLRQRVAFALSEIFVVSFKGIFVDYPANKIANFYDVLRQGAFGNFRDLLKNVTLSSAMGHYLNMSGNFDKHDGVKPDENYAREVLQLMSIGLYELNLDGSLKVDTKGRPIPTYSQADISGLAAVFTGWKNATGKVVKTMSTFPQYHTLGAKTFLGKTLPALTISNPTSAQIQSYQNAELEAALDVIFKHPNVGPFIAIRLIQRLTMSNPSPGYVQSVASVFNNNGLGVRGDMFAVVKAVLQGGQGQAIGPYSGRLREPWLRFTHLLRALDAKDAAGKPSKDAPGRTDLTAVMYSPFTANSVFNFWYPDYSPPNSVLKTNAMNAPELQEVYTSSSVSYINAIANAVNWGSVTPQLEHKIDYAALADDLAVPSTGKLDADRALARLDLLFCAGLLGAPLKTQIRTAWANILPNKAAPSADDLREVRVVQLKAAITLIMVSIDYLVQF